MSRAFVCENDSWEYCQKAGERCMMAEKDRECTSKSCQYASKPEAPADRQYSENRDKFVRVNRGK